MHGASFSFRGMLLLGLAFGAVESANAAEIDHILFQSIRRGNTHAVASLLRQGTPANLRSPDGTTALMYAALRGDTESVRLLIAAGALVDARGSEFTTKALACAYSGLSDNRQSRMSLDDLYK